MKFACDPPHFEAPIKFRRSIYALAALIQINLRLKIAGRVQFAHEARHRPNCRQHFREATHWFENSVRRLVGWSNRSQPIFRVAPAGNRTPRSATVLKIARSFSDRTFQPDNASDAVKPA